jgi:tRNA threonylcarbamoyl adenosine modification protein YjeE
LGCEGVLSPIRNPKSKIENRWNIILTASTTPKPSPRDLAQSLRPGDVIALHGDLGAGKTQFVRGLVRGLGGDARAVSSPTFVLLNVYDTGRLVVHHLDAYRVHGPEDFESIGFAELLEQGGVVAVEWPQRVADILPPRRIDVRIIATGDHSRRIEIDDRRGTSSGEGHTDP